MGIDNRCSTCMSDVRKDFVPGSLRPVAYGVKGVGGIRIKGVEVGTMIFSIEDDDGMVHTSEIPGSHLVPSLGTRLFSPQHFAQTRKDKSPLPYGTKCTTYDDCVVLKWGQRKFRRTIPIDTRTNVATFNTAPGFGKFATFCQMAAITDDQDENSPTMCFETGFVSEGESSDEEDAEELEDCERHPREEPLEAEFNLDGPPEGSKAARKQLPIVIEEEEDRQLDNTSAELLRLHQKFVHISFRRIQRMAKRGILPRKLANCPIPVCTACMFGKATRRKWRHKDSDKDAPKFIPTKPGQVVSVDQMMSPTPGLMAQMVGKPTKARYNCATVYVDQATGCGFIHLQKSTDGEETVKSKVAFERWSAEHGVKIQHYHADNGIFNSKVWRAACTANGQGLTFAGTNAHHQNGVAERRIRDIQDGTRTSLSHAHRRWSSAITANLWPYAARMYQDAINNAPNLKFKDGRTPMEGFAGTTVTVNPRDWYHFGCPAYVLDTALQSGTIFHKWKDRSVAGIYLGRSPQHARSVALILNITTGMVTPQFHVKFDPSFHTTKKGEEIPRSLWQAKCGFLDKKTDKKGGKAKGRKRQGDESDLPLGEDAPRGIEFEGEPIEQLPPEGEIPPDEEGDLQDSFEQAPEGDSATGDDEEADEPPTEAEPTEARTHRQDRSRYGRHRKSRKD